MTKYTEFFDGMSSLVDELNSLPILSKAQSSVTGDMEFCSSESFDDAQGLVYRWDDGADRINRVRTTINDNLSAQGFDYRPAVVPPGVLHMGRYLEGQPYVYVRRVPNDEKVAGRGKVARIVVNCAASGMVSATVLETRGGAVLSLIDSLEAAGKTVEVEVACGIRYGNNTFDARFLVKRAGEPLNLASIAYAVAHPSMLRRHIFRLMETRKYFKDIGVENYYGYPADVDHGEGEIYLGKMYGSEPEWRTPQTAARWVIDTLKDQGITVEGKR